MIRVGSIFIPVTDLEKSVKWYEKHLGIHKIQEWGEGAAKGVGFYFPNDSTQLGLVQVENVQATEFHVKAEQRNSYFNFLVDDIQAFYEQLNSKGVKTNELEHFGGMACFDFFDLDDNPFSVVSEMVDSPFHADQVKKMQGIKR
ncbi:VOC family protein [Guptibacillus hwajinpoensis]|uniref:VOC family protein n=1 Tax=Guptibacillus hwajinpoensis TaxID=208199 RepID=UPI00384AE965